MGILEITFLLLMPAMYFIMLAVERAWPGRSFPPRTGWQWLGIVFLLLSMAVGNALPLFLPLDWMAEHRWFDGTGLGVIGGAIVGFVVLELAVYLWHRSTHTFDPMWRMFHQIHHSPKRVDLAGSVLFHPVEMMAYTVISLFVTVLVLGLDPLAAAITGSVYTFYAFFQHWNVRTPQWLGYLIQRPESHCEHHRMGVHYNNFSDLPLWDIIFGTFRNPREYVGECGFEGERDRRLAAMLAFQDVNAAPYGSGSLGARPDAGGRAAA